PREKPFHSRFRADSTAPARPLVAYGLVLGASRTSAVQVRCVLFTRTARLRPKRREGGHGRRDQCCATSGLGPSSTTNSTRRFFARFAWVSLETMGRSAPNPFARSREASIPAAIRWRSTDSARRCESRRL